MIFCTLSILTTDWDLNHSLVRADKELHFTIIDRPQVKSKKMLWFIMLDVGLTRNNGKGTF